MPAHIRNIEPADIDAVRALHYAHLSAAAMAEFYELNPKLVARTEQILAGSEGVCLVAEIEGTIAGYLIGTLVDAPMTTIKYASLDNLLVLNDYRRQGIGSSLVASFKAWAKDSAATRIKVDASPRNQAAINLYAHFGFTPATLTLETAVD